MQVGRVEELVKSLHVERVQHAEVAAAAVEVEAVVEVAVAEGVVVEEIDKEHVI